MGYITVFWEYVFSPVCPSSIQVIWWWPPFNYMWHFYTTTYHILQCRSQSFSHKLIVASPFLTQCQQALCSILHRMWKWVKNIVQRVGGMWTAVLCFFYVYFPLPFCPQSVSLSISLAIAHYHIIVSLVRRIGQPNVTVSD